MDKQDTALAIALKHDMQVFDTLKPNSKYVSITKNIIEYQKSIHKFAVAKNDEIKNECLFSGNRSFASASTKVKNLTPEQLLGFENYLVNRYGSVEDNKALESMQIIKTAITLLESVGKTDTQLNGLLESLENDWVM